MNRRLALTTLVVADYDEAIAWYTGKLGFALLEDIDQGHKRWVVVGPTDGSAAALLLARASDEAQRSRIGNQTGGRVAFFLNTDDFHRDHAAEPVSLFDHHHGAAGNVAEALEPVVHHGRQQPQLIEQQRLAVDRNPGLWQRLRRGSDRLARIPR